VALAYSVDVAPSREALSPDAACDALWSHSAEALTVTLAYGQLGGACRLHASINSTSIVRTGWVGLFLVAKGADANATVVAEWLYPVEITFLRSVVAVYEPLAAWAPTLVQGVRVHSGAFKSTLRLYESNLYTDEKAVAVYKDGDRVFAEHLMNAEDLPMTPRLAWLSQVADAAAPAVHNLTGSISVQEVLPGFVRFSVQVATCRNCFLHVLSDVALSGRALSLAGATTHSMIQRVPVDVLTSSGLPKLAIPVGTALTLATLSSILVGVLARSLMWGLAKFMRGRSEITTCKFLAIETFDLVLDVLAYAMCKAEGDLEFEDDAGWVSKSLLISVVASGIIFFAEVGLLCCRRARSAQFLPWLVCAHLMLEDTFQLIMYAIVAASQMAIGIRGSDALVLAMTQACLCVVVKAIDILAPMVAGDGYAVARMSPTPEGSP